MALINSINKTSESNIAALALQTAQGQVGQSEHPVGSNSGPMVNEYLKAAGLNPGYAWCQAFVYWCYRQAATALNRQSPLVKTAGVHDCWSRSVVGPELKKLQRQDTINNPELLQPGDQFILSFGAGEGHTGIIEQVVITPATTKTLASVTIHTIEGNSNTNGSREGYEVVKHIRNLDDKALIGFIQYS